MYVTLLTIALPDNGKKYKKKSKLCVKYCVRVCIFIYMIDLSLESLQTKDARSQNKDVTTTCEFSSIVCMNDLKCV